MIILKINWDWFIIMLMNFLKFDIFECEICVFVLYWFSVLELVIGEWIKCYSIE